MSSFNGSKEVIGHLMTPFDPLNDRTPRDIFESFILVKGGHRVTYDPL